MKRDAKLYLEDILESIKRIEESTLSLNKNEFSNNITIQDAVIRRFEIIGEAVKNLPQDFKDNHPEIAWKEIAGMRNVLTHAYFEVSVERVWNTVQKDLPHLKEQIQNLLQK